MVRICSGVIARILPLGKGLVNLWEANRLQLLKCGIPDSNIEVVRMCTFCMSDTIFSVRHQRDETGRFATGIVLQAVAVGRSGGDIQASANRTIV